MNTLDAHLGGLRDRPSFFLYRLDWNESKGKYDKRPCTLDGRTWPVTASANLTAYATARTALQRLPRGQYALGFWFTADSGYWFLDIDKLPGDYKTDDRANNLLEMFPGAFVEWSSSKRGIHIIGRADSISPHTNRNDTLHLEFYTADRGICFGLDGVAGGCADTRFDLAPLVAAYFPPRPEHDHAGERRPEWRGPEDDGELLQRALSARVSAAAAFGGKATFAQLWGGEVGGDDRSSADMALAAHLAFWTGCDTERIERLMWRSGLVRDKWRERRPGGTYLTYTIENACARCANVYQEKAPPPLPPLRNGEIRSAADLLRREFKPVQWAIRDIIPEGVTIISGDPKIGKSWLVYQSCVAVAAGFPLWNGRMPETQGGALMLALEDTDRRLRSRLDKLLAAFPGADVSRLHYVTEWPRAEAGVAKLRDFLSAHPECRIVVIDTVSAFRDNDPGRMSAYAHDYAVGEMLKPLVREFNCAIALVMHNRKQAAGDVMHKVSGTQGMTGSVDNVLILERKRGQTEAVLHVDGRDIENPQELVLQLNHGVWACLGVAEDVFRTKERSAVLEAVVSLGGHGTAKDIHDAIGDRVTLSAVKMRLSRMHKAGEIDKNGRIYTLPNPAEKFAAITPLS